MERQLIDEGDKVKTQVERKFKIHSKLELQLREAEMIASLATTLGMTRAELESELKKSVEGKTSLNTVTVTSYFTLILTHDHTEQGHSHDSAYGILLSKSLIQLFESSDGT